MDPKSNSYVEFKNGIFKQNYLGYDFILDTNTREIIVDFNFMGISMYTDGINSIVNHTILKDDYTNQEYTKLSGIDIKRVKILQDKIFEKLSDNDGTRYIDIKEEFNALYNIIKLYEIKEDIPFKSLIETNDEKSYVKLLSWQSDGSFDLYFHISVQGEDSQAFELSYDSQEKLINVYDMQVRDLIFKHKILDIAYNREKISHKWVLRYMNLLKFEARARNPRDGEVGSVIYDKYKPHSHIFDDCGLYSVILETTSRKSCIFKLKSKLSDRIQMQEEYQLIDMSNNERAMLMKSIAFLIDINTQGEFLEKIINLLI